MRDVPAGTVRGTGSGPATGVTGGYIPAIDGLRAVAVLAVLLFHIRDTLVPGGFAGVDVFFVISGYVVSASLADRPEPRLRSYIAGFYSRRIVRIFPALLICVLVTGVATSLLVPASWLSQTTSRIGIASVYGLSNFALVMSNDPYFAPRAEFNPFTHTWSLGVEEQFYLIFPLMFYAWFHFRSQRGLTGQLGRMVMPIALLASLGYCAYATSTRHDLAYYMLTSRFWELACGAMLFRWHHAGRLLPASPRTAGSSIVAGAALVGIAFAWGDPRAFPFPWAVPAVLGSMLVISGSVGDVSGRSRSSALLGSRPVTYVGRTSYSLYLWHWPVLVLLRWTVGLESAAVQLLAGAVSIGLGALSYHTIERGAWWRRRITGWAARRIVAVGVASVLVCALGLAGILSSQPYISRSVTSDRQTWYPLAWPSATSCSSHSLLGRKMFVWGDSHTGAYSTMLQELREETCVEVHLYTFGGCGVAGLLIPSPAVCRSEMTDTAAEIRRAGRPGDFVFLASLRVPRLADQWGTVRKSDGVSIVSPPSDRQRAAALREASALISSFEDARMRVIIDAPMPIFRTPPFRCSDSFNAHNAVCANGFEIRRSFLESLREPTMEALARLEAGHPALVVWDPFPILCPQSRCSEFDGSRPLFFDGNHLSAHGNRVLFPSFKAVVMSTASA